MALSFGEKSKVATLKQCILQNKVALFNFECKEIGRPEWSSSVQPLHPLSFAADCATPDGHCPLPAAYAATAAGGQPSKQSDHPPAGTDAACALPVPASN